MSLIISQNIVLDYTEYIISTAENTTSPYISGFFFFGQNTTTYGYLWDDTFRSKDIYSVVMDGYLRWLEITCYVVEGEILLI